MLTRLYGCVTVRAGFLHPSGGLRALSAAQNASEKHLYR